MDTLVAGAALCYFVLASSQNSQRGGSETLRGPFPQTQQKMEVTQIAFTSHSFDDAVRRQYGIDEVFAHRCVAPQVPKTYFSIGVVFGRSGSGKSSTLRKFVQNESLWLTEDALFKAVQANIHEGFLVCDEFTSFLAPDAKKRRATQLRRAVLPGSKVVVALNDAEALKHLGADWVFDTDLCKYVVPPTTDTGPPKALETRCCTPNPALSRTITNNNYNVGLIISAGNCESMGTSLCNLPPHHTYDGDRSLLSQLNAETVGEATSLLDAVGLKSIMTWLIPFKMLSVGQKARAQLIPSIQQSNGETAATCVLDFGVTIDNVTACTTAYTFGASIRKRHGRVVVVANNDEILPFLKPDWVWHENCTLVPKYRPRDIECKIALQQVKGSEQTDVWNRLKYYHYLSHEHVPTCTFKIMVKCPLLGNGDEMEAGMISLQCNPAWSKNEKAERYRTAHRFVLSPTFQGMRLGSHVCDLVGALITTADLEFRFITSHEGLVRKFRASPKKWTEYQNPKEGGGGSRVAKAHAQKPDRKRYFFKYVGERLPLDRPAANHHKQCLACTSVNWPEKLIRYENDILL